MDNTKGFKAFTPGLVCKGKQYAENTDFEEAGGDICGKGMMHYCVSPFDCLDYYPLIGANGKPSDFAAVEALETPVTDDGRKFATKKLHIGLKLGLPGFVKACVDFMKVQTIDNMPKSDLDIGSSGDAAKIGSSGDAAQIGSSGYAAQIGSSGYAAQIGSSGNAAKIGSSGYAAQIGSSGNAAQIGSSGDAAKIGSSGDAAQIGSSGYAAQIGSSGNAAKIGSSGDAAKIGSSGDAAKIGSSGYAAQIGSSGNAAQIGSSGNAAKIGSSGNAAKIGSSGYAAQIESTGEDSVICCAGHGSKVNAKIGSWVTLSEWKYSDKKERFVPICVKTEFVDGVRIKPDTWYELVAGEFREVADG